MDHETTFYQVEAVPSFRDKVHVVINEILAQEQGCRFAVSRLSLLESLAPTTMVTGDNKFATVPGLPCRIIS